MISINNTRNSKTFSFRQKPVYLRIMKKYIHEKSSDFRFGIVLFTFFLACLHNKSAAQLSVIHEYTRTDSIIVLNESSDTLQFPFAGGLNSCQFMNLDVNLDGTDDLLVFDRHGNRILPFLVSPQSPFNYTFAPELVAGFPPVIQWMQCIDYNNDGKKDIFTYTTGGIKVYRNDSDSKLLFTQVTWPFLLSQQGSTLTNILVTSVDYPAIADVDNDGDYDVLSFWGLGSFLELHKNTSVERFGNSDSLTYEKVSSCWGHFAEGNEDNTIIFDTCVGGGNYKQSCGIIADDPKHTGSTLLFHDLNSDGLADITIGDVDFNTVIHLTNGGTVDEARMVSQTTNFPNTTDPVNMNTFPAAMFADVNNDGYKDLLVSPFDPSLIKGENQESISLYLNLGTGNQPDYNLFSESFLQDEMLDLGSGAYPAFFDYNGDGLIDLLVGNYGYSDTCIFLPATGLQCTFTSQIALLLNIGTNTHPAFRLADRNIAHLDVLQMQSLIPTLADMDGDGDSDMVCGNSKGKLVYCKNIALAGQPAQFELVDPAWKLIDVGDFSSPQLIDIDKDGLIDLICGKRNGTLNYYRNTGSAADPEFLLVNEKFGAVDVTDTILSNYGYILPCFYQDKNGETFLFAGSEYGDIFVYDQINNNLDGEFRFLGTLPGVSEGWRSGVTLGNLDNDTLSDIIIGNYSGGMGLYFGKPGKLFGLDEYLSNSNSRLLITPNPAFNQVSVSIVDNLTLKSYYVVIQSVEGKILSRYTDPEFPFLIDVSGMKNGIYLVSVTTEKGVASGKMVISR